MHNAQLQNDLDAIIATQAGLMAIVASLMATHPQYERLQLHLTGLLEILLTGAAGITFSLWKHCSSSRKRRPSIHFSRCWICRKGHQRDGLDTGPIC